MCKVLVIVHLNLAEPTHLPHSTLARRLITPAFVGRLKRFYSRFKPVDEIPSASDQSRKATEQ